MVSLSPPKYLTLENICAPPFLEGDEYVVEQLNDTPDTTFVSYNFETGMWIFNVDDFSSSYSTVT
jgi:hypothetical protein